MIESATAQSYTTTNVPPAPKKGLTMVKNERMGGFVPKWETVKSTANVIERNFENVLADARNANFAPKTDAALAYHPTPPHQPTTSEEFGLSDVLDIVNPLQHIPVVNQLYREFTGDQIKPSSKIVGGALFGGPAGAAGGLIDAIIVHETGRDMTANAFNMAFRREMPKFRSASNELASPQNQIERAIKETGQPYDNDTTRTMLSFSNLAASETPAAPQKYAHQLRSYNA